MRHEPNRRIEPYRTEHPELGTSDYGANWGFFVIPKPGGVLRVISSGDTTDNPYAQGWEHVSVSLATRIPTWDEMCLVKELFWRDDETVLQFHPKKAEYVNFDPHVLHLWKRDGVDAELPPMQLIAPRATP